MTENVEYSVSMRDLITGKLRQAEGAAMGLENKLHQASAAASNMGSKLMSGLKMLGVGFAAFKGIELIHEGVEAVEQLHQAQAQVQAGLKSTGYAAGMTAKDLEGFAADLSSQTKYSRADVTSMQSLLLTFPSIMKDQFPAASQVIADMSTRMGTDMKGAAIQVGKALQDPIHGISALKRVGVNFNETQVETIKNLVATGQSAKAQGLILAELNTEFGGSAKAAFDADPLAKYNKTMGSMKMAMGEMGLAVIETVQPALMGLANAVKWVATMIKDVVHWFHEHEAAGKAIAIGLGVVAAYYGIITLATSVWTAAQWLLNAALTANPIGVVVVGIAALVAGIVYAWESCAQFRAVVMGLWGTIKEFGSIVGDVFTGVMEMIKGVMNLDANQVMSGWDKAAGAMGDAGKRMASAYKEGYNGVMDADKKEKAEKEKSALTKTPEKKNTGVIVAAADVKDAKAKKDTSPKGATGSKSVTINISIGKLIETFKVQTNNIGEGTGKVREMVAQTLLSAVNDSQITAGI